MEHGFGTDVNIGQGKKGVDEQLAISYRQQLAPRQ